MRTKKSDNAVLSAARRKAQLSDEWDCIVQWVLETDPEAKGALRDAIEHLTGYSERWLDVWSSGRASIEYEHEPNYLPCAELLQWARARLHLADEDWRQWQQHFFKSLDNLPEYDFIFVGRVSELEELEQRLENNSRVCLSAAALHGIGGIGKTAIAYHYSRLKRSSYAAILWIDARGDIEQQFHDFARFEANLMLKDDGAKSERIADTYTQLAFNFRGRILIVFDDVPVNPNSGNLPHSTEENIDLIVASLPKHLSCRYDMLLTSRHKHKIASIDVEPMTIGRMSREDAVMLFLQRSGFDPASLNRNKLEELVDVQLGGHPLAIALVASFARLRRTRSLDRLSALIEERIVDSDALRGIKLGEYSNEIYRAFEISFEALTRDAQLLLLVLALFRRGVIAVETLKSCAKHMPGTTPDVNAFKLALSSGGGPTTNARLLTRLALAERVDSADLRDRSMVRHIQLHEVIYDFAQAQWTVLRQKPEWKTVLDDLEVSFTQGAIEYSSTQIDAATIRFQDVDTLTGLLLPIVRAERGLIPLPVRINIALRFWYEHFVFQNFIYDTGLQDDLLDQMLALLSYLKEQKKLEPFSALILHKLIGHAYYADPTNTGPLAHEHFDQALALAERMDATAAPSEGDISIARWYKVFLLDHRSNVASKYRARAEQTQDIRGAEDFAKDFDAIEAALPDSLQSLTTPPSEEECELLLRAAHYWGHRGNQDGYIQYQRFLEGTLNDDDPISTAAKDHYVKAVNYRLLALWIFRNGQFSRHFGKKRIGALPFLVPWLQRARPLLPQKRFESFTSLAQGIGDTAHQYRQLHFVFAIEFLATQDAAKRAPLRFEAERSLHSARELWALAKQTSTAAEAPLRYRLWMNSSDPVMDLLDVLNEGKPIAPLDQVLTQFRGAIGQMQKSMRSLYPHSVKQQESQLRAIWEKVGNA